MTESSEKAGASRRNFLKIGVGVVAGAAIASAVEIPYYSSMMGGNSSSSSLESLQSELTNTQSALNSATANLSSLSSQLSAATAQNSSLNAQVATLQGQVTSASSQANSLQSQITTSSAFAYLNADQQGLVEAIASTIIPTDSNGPGGKSAGVAYFIDRQMGSDYGTSGDMYMQGPFVTANQTSSITVEKETYSAGSAPQGLISGGHYQYPMQLRYFISTGLTALESYANSAYGGNYATLSAADQTKVLQDLWNGKPTSFGGISPVDFAYELFFLVWSGYLTDPSYGGNINMVGWQLVGFNGTNFGDFYNEGLSAKQLMLATTPTKLQPASLGQFQQANSGGS